MKLAQHLVRVGLIKMDEDIVDSLESVDTVLDEGEDLVESVTLETPDKVTDSGRWFREAGLVDVELENDLCFELKVFGTSGVNGPHR